MNLLGIDIGGTKTGVCIGNEEGRIFASRRMATQSRDSLDVYMTRLTGICREAAAEAGVRLADLACAGISAPGPLSVPRGLLYRPPNNPGWHDVPIVELCRTALQLPVFMNNDANAAGLAEYRFGGHRGARSLVYLTCSTGMGGGIVLDGRIVQGENDMGGEVGHQVLDPNGPLCACGMRGCFEAYCGGHNVAEGLKTMIREQKIETAIVAQAGGDIDKIDHRAFTAAARAGDAFALRQWDIFVEHLAQGIGNLIMVLNPQVMILGTIAITEGDFLMKPLLEKLPRYAWPWPLAACTVVPSALGKSIGDLSGLAVAMDGLPVLARERAAAGQG